MRGLHDSRKQEANCHAKVAQGAHRRHGPRALLAALDLTDHGLQQWGGGSVARGQQAGQQQVADEVGYENARKEQQERGRSAAALDTEDWVTLIDNVSNKFVGYDSFETKSKIIKYSIAILPLNP